MSSLITIRTNIRTTYLKIDPNAKVWDNNTVDYFANIAYDKVQEDFQHSIPVCEWSTTISTVGSTQEYTKPSDFVRVTGIFYNWTKLSRINKETALLNISETTRPSSYYIYGSYLGLYPTPDSTYSLQMLYKKKLPALTETQDSLMETDMEDLVVLYACYLMFISVEKQVKANMCITQYENKKNWLFMKYLYDDDNMLFELDRPTNWYRDNVIY
jgi:hypothetical protein